MLSSQLFFTMAFSFLNFEKCFPELKQSRIRIRNSFPFTEQRRIGREPLNAGIRVSRLKLLQDSFEFDRVIFRDAAHT